MKKLISVLGGLMVIFLLINLAHAVEPAGQEELKAQEISLSQKHSEKRAESAALKAVVLNSTRFGSKFFLN